VPVVIESDDDTAPCAGGVVVDLDPHGDGFLAVKAGPGLNYARIDKLYNNGDGSNTRTCPWVEATCW
jgi:hypothetical protein